MRYAPHTLQANVEPTAFDEYGRPARQHSEWVTVGGCRCDKSGDTEITSDTGQLFRPSWHIVTDRADVKAGTEVRVIDGDGGMVARGVAKSVKSTNWYDYTEIWV